MHSWKVHLAAAPENQLGGQTERRGTLMYPLNTCMFHSGSHLINFYHYLGGISWLYPLQR